MMRFYDRAQAGKQLAARLSAYAHRDDVLVLALPRGGVPVGFEVARTLNVPLDIFVVRKLGVPGHRELAMGAIASGGIRVINEAVVEELAIAPALIDQVAAAEKHELERREIAYRGYSVQPRLRGKVVILVDDGIATGSTMRAAIAALRKQEPARLILAVPTAALSSFSNLQGLVDEAIALMLPEDFYAVGQWYEDFAEVTDAEVTFLLREARRLHLPHKPSGAEVPVH